MSLLILKNQIDLRKRRWPKLYLFIFYKFICLFIKLYVLCFSFKTMILLISQYFNIFGSDLNIMP